MQLDDYLRFIRLPDTKLTKGKISQECLDQGMDSLWKSIAYVKHLPYRPLNNHTQVLKEKCGACGSKHAFLAALGHELSIPLKLMLGIFLLTSQNTPKIEPILAKYDLPHIPEAHCFLEYGHHTLDVTFPNTTEFSVIFPLEQKWVITPDQIGEYKKEQHQAFIKQTMHADVSEVWKARQEWIASLSTT